jgi:hypothetical protein
MNISIFGHSISLEILTLIGVIYLILVGHTFCSCTKLNGYGFMEGLANMAASNKDTPPKPPIKKPLLKTQTAPGSISTQPADAVKVKTVGGKEGFTGANINYGESSQYEIGNDNPVDTKNWFQPNLTVVPGQPLSQGVKDFLARPEQKIDPSKFFFDDIPFAPSCCPSTYSNSQGCACLNSKTFNGLITRFGNNSPYSQF